MKERLEARLKELLEAHSKAAEQAAMLRGAVAEVRRLLAEEEQHEASTHSADAAAR